MHESERPDRKPIFTERFGLVLLAFLIIGYVVGSDFARTQNEREARIEENGVVSFGER